MKVLERKMWECIKEFNLIQKGEVNILLGVSGGPDSMAMLRSFEKTAPRRKIQFGVAHFNHKLRPDSKKDAEFVEKYCAEKGIPFFLGERKEQKPKGESPEEFARRLRYSFLEKTAESYGYHLIATAHTADDQVETVLLRIIRGTGVEGLKGILPRSGKVIRPLLKIWREEVFSYLDSEKLPYIIDPTNLNKRIPRNLLRNEVLPLLTRYYPKVKESLLKLWESALFLEEYSEALKKLTGEILQKNKEISISVSGKEDILILRTIIAHLYGFPPSSKLTALLRKLVTSTGYREISLKKNLKVERVGDKIVIKDTKVCYKKEKWEEKIDREGTYQTPHFYIDVKIFGKNEISISPDPYQAFMDAEKVSFPIIVRNWEPGDKFTPLGIKGTKKLQDLFTDLKIPKPIRSRYPVFLSGGEIIWVGGIRISERVKVKESTQKILWIKLTPRTRESL